MNPAVHAAETYVRAIRTGEHAASVALAALLAPEVVLETNGPMPGSPTETLTGQAAVLRRASGNWAWTAALRHARWSEAKAEGGAARVEATFEKLGGVVPAALAVSVSIDAQGRIARVEQKYTPRQVQPSERIPACARPHINNARVSEAPFTVAYTDETGNPVLTFRGSVQVLDDQTLCAWIRAADGSLMRSIAKNPAIALAYRDGPRAMLLVAGRARLDTSAEMRARVYELIPEVEQNHDPARKGAALLIDVDRMQGFVGDEPVRMVRKA